MTIHAFACAESNPDHISRKMEVIAKDNGTEGAWNQYTKKEVDRVEVLGTYAHSIYEVVMELMEMWVE